MFMFNFPGMMFYIFECHFDDEMFIKLIVYGMY